MKVADQSIAGPGTKPGDNNLMTLERPEFRCPTCGHIMGEEEYRGACNQLNKKVQEMYSQRQEEQEKRHRQEMQAQEQRHRQEFETAVKQEAQFQIDIALKQQEELNNEKYEEELKRKNEELNNVKSQTNSYIDEKVGEAVMNMEEKHRQKETEYNLHINRIQKVCNELVEKNQKMEKILQNVPAEFRGTCSEIMLFEDLKNAFPQDHLVPKIVGVEMPDVIQTVVTNNGERISTRILWDKKTGENIIPKDIEKAKRYKEKYDTDYCIIVTANGIASKASKNYRTVLIGKREGVMLVHPKIVVGVAELIRNFIIENTRLINNHKGRTSKQISLYDYITGSARFRKIQEKMEKKLRLDELQRKEEAYIKKTWTERRQLIQAWFELEREDQDFICAITQNEDGVNGEC